MIPTFAYVATILSRVDMASLKVLEIGCGNGLNSVVAALSGAQVTATDLVKDAIRIARLSSKLNDVEHRMAFKNLSWNNLETFPESQFDVVLASDCLFFSGAIDPLVKATLKALKPGGIAILVDLFHLHACELVQMLKERDIEHEMLHLSPNKAKFSKYQSSAFLKVKTGTFVLFRKSSCHQSQRLKDFKRRVIKETPQFLPK